MPSFGMSKLAPVLLRDQFFYPHFNRQYFRKVLSHRPIAYWPLWEASGSVAYDLAGNALHGAYTGVTLGQVGVGDGRSCPLFDGVSDFCNIYSAGLNTAWDGAEGSASIWLKSYGDFWTTAGAYPFNIEVDSNNRLIIYTIGDGTLLFRRAGGGTASNITSSDLETTDWLHFVFTWSEAVDDEFKAYVNGVQEGATQTGLGAYTTDPLHSDFCNIGAQSSVPVGTTEAYFAHGAVFDKVLTLPEIEALATV